MEVLYPRPCLRRFPPLTFPSPPSSSALFCDSLSQGVALINDLPSGKLPKLLQKILGKLHLQDDKTFTTDEEVGCPTNVVPAVVDIAFLSSPCYDG